MTQPAAPTDRVQGALEDILKMLLPRLRSAMASYLPWEYRINLITPGTPTMISCVPVDPVACPFGQLVIPLGKGPSGIPSIPVDGSTVVVRFLDGNPSKPIVDALDPLVPTVPPTAPVVDPTKPLTLAGALAQFAATLPSGVPGAGVACTTLASQLTLLL